MPQTTYEITTINGIFRLVEINIKCFFHRLAFLGLKFLYGCKGRLWHLPADPVLL